MRRFVYMVLPVLLLGYGCLYATNWTDVDDVYAWDEPSQVSSSPRQVSQEQEDAVQADLEEFQLQLYDHPQVHIILDQDTIVKAIIHRE